MYIKEYERLKLLTRIYEKGLENGKKVPSEKTEERLVMLSLSSFLLAFCIGAFALSPSCLYFVFFGILFGYLSYRLFSIRYNRFFKPVQDKLNNFDKEIKKYETEYVSHMFNEINEGNINELNKYTVAKIISLREEEIKRENIKNEKREKEDLLLNFKKVKTLENESRKVLHSEIINE